MQEGPDGWETTFQSVKDIQWVKNICKLSNAHPHCTAATMTLAMDASSPTVPLCIYNDELPSVAANAHLIMLSHKKKYDDMP